MKEIKKMRKALAKVIRIELKDLDDKINHRLSFLKVYPECKNKEMLQKNIKQLEKKYEDLSISLLDVEDMDDVRKEFFDEIMTK